jgi:hypothetical protein
MANMNVEGTLTFSLVIDHDSGLTHGRYRDYAPMEKHHAKTQLMAKLTDPAVGKVLAQWKYLLIPVEEMAYELSDDEMRAFIDRRIRDSADDLRQHLGFVPEVGEPAIGAVCAKLPTCGHICEHMYELRGAGGEPWTATSEDGVTARIVASLSWITPPM